MSRLVVYDKTCLRGRRGLSPIWAAGARLYRMLGWIDDARGVATWSEALAWLASWREPIHEIQYWGHGDWGRALVDRESFDITALSRHASDLAAIRERLVPDAVVWFRTCKTLGAHPGHELAMRLSDTLAASVAGHTYVIAYHQSGLHALAPGMRPDWSAREGLASGTPDAPGRGRWSSWHAPHTVTALDARVPSVWFSGLRAA